jgi:hypothetical protein
MKPNTGRRRLKSRMALREQTANRSGKHIARPCRRKPWRAIH